MKYDLLRLFFIFFSFLIPIKKKLYVFGSWHGKKYGDNPRGLYEYLYHNNQHELYWFSKVDVSQSFVGTPKNWMKGLSIKSLWVHMRAEAVFCNCSPSSDLLGYALNRKTIVFNLWHGTPIKLIGKDALATGKTHENLGTEKLSLANKIARSIVSRKLINGLKNKTYFLASSKKVSSILQQAMDIPSNKIIISGYPKLDTCFTSLPISQNSRKTILYAPTYRGIYGSEKDILTYYGFDTQKIDLALQEKGLNLLIRSHPANYLPKKIVSEIENSRNISIDKNEDVYDTLSIVDIIVTDFSSIYFDAIAVNKIAILAPFGIASYTKNDRELYYDLPDIFPGVMTYNWDEFIKLLDTYITFDIDLYAKIKNDFYPFQSKTCAKDLTNIIDKILLNK
ncbi:CDP-glycerol glycerophosphotransferase family protein [Hafnia alvei]|uniref:CDP-glycerol glycerophosphotransferase family protein n=1 Tax=Hafnia alvei TaxID=569 RepID=UPI0040455551